MVWSEQTGTSLIVPTDANPDDPTDTRDYIILGEDVPSEIASAMQAGLVFHNKTATTGKPQWWALGITQPDGNLEMIAWFQSPMSGTAQPETLFSLGFTPDATVTVGGGSYPGKAGLETTGAVNFDSYVEAHAGFQVDQGINGQIAPGWTYVVNSTGFSWGVPASTTTAPGCQAIVDVPPGKTLDVEFKAPRVRTTSTNTGVYISLIVNGAVADYNEILLPASTTAVPARLTGSYTNTGLADVNVDIHAQAAATAGGIIDRGNFANFGAVVFRYRII